MALTYDKPFKSYKEQIEYLRSEHGLIIDDEDFAQQALSDISYYDLINGYQECFMSSGRFTNRTNIKFLYLFYLFDKGFQNLIFRQSLLIENSFKTKLAYTVGQSFGEDHTIYLADKNYPSSPQYLRTLWSIKKRIGEYQTAPYKAPNPLRHYIEHHNHIPPWILFKNISFGNAIDLFRMLESKRKAGLVQEILPNAKVSLEDRTEFLVSGLNIIRELRNRIAHNLKFVTYKSSALRSPKVALSLFPKGMLSWRDLRKGERELNDIYTAILLITTFLNRPFLQYAFLLPLMDYVTVRRDQNELANRAIVQRYYEITELPVDFETRLRCFLHRR